VRGRAPLLLAVLFLPLLSPCRAAAEPSRTEARAALAAPSSAVEARRAGALSLARHGRMEDVPVLVGALRDPDALVRAFAETALWQVWSRSGDDEVDALFELGLEQMRASEGGLAAETFTRIIQRKPEFAEGWNKRATVYYLLGQYEKSLADCDEVLKRNPYHFGALSGYGMIYLKLDQPARALGYFERALGINPNLSSVRETVEVLKELLGERRKDTI